MKDNATFHIPLSFPRILSDMNESDCRIVWEKLTGGTGIAYVSAKGGSNGPDSKDQIISAVTRFFSVTANLKKVA